MDASVFRGRQLRFDAVILQKHFIIPWHGNLSVVAETRAVACIGVGLCTRIELDFSRDRHHQDIAQIGVSRAAEMGMAKTHDGAVFVLITSTILIHSRLINPIDIVWHSVGVGAELHDAERCIGTRKSVPHTISPDDGIDILDKIGNGF